MGNFKVKFRPSTVAGKAGTVYYQVYHARQVKTIRTDYKLYAEEWSKADARIVIEPGSERCAYLLSVRHRLEADIRRLASLIRLYRERAKDSYTAADLAKAFRTMTVEGSFASYGRGAVERLRGQGRERTSEAYVAALQSFLRFSNGRDFSLEEIDWDLMKNYEYYLKQNHLTMNTVSFYMRVLRAIYNSAVERKLTEQRFPFRYVYTGIDKTVKRAVSLQVIRRIKEMDFSGEPHMAFARDMFLFSFYTRGMSFVDMAFLRKEDLSGGILSYRRRKTGQQLLIKWEPCMQYIVGRYRCDGTPYLLPIVGGNDRSERRQYLNTLFMVNRRLKEISRRLRLPVPLTMYVARHSWASIARSRHIPLSVISEGMGHGSEHTTQIYLASLDTAEVDKANGQILSLL